MMKLSPEQIDRHVGARLRFFRDLNGYTQAYLAKSVNLTFQQIQKYEQGSNRISASKLWQFCDLLGVTPNDFYEGLQEVPQTVDSGVSRRVAETALLLHEMKDDQVKRSVLDLIRHMRKTESAPANHLM